MYVFVNPKKIFLLSFYCQHLCACAQHQGRKGEMFILFSGHAQASDPDPEIAAKHGQDARQ